MGQMRADSGPYLIGLAGQSQPSSSQVVGGAHVNQQTTMPTNQQRRGHQNNNTSNTSGIRGGEKQSQGPTTS